MARAFWVWLHRWVGLVMTGFLIVVGLTGSLLVFWLELSHWLTPDLYPASRPGIELGAATLARRAEALVPQARTNTVYLGYPGSIQIGMEARPGSPALGFNYLHLDPVTGSELGRVNWEGLPRSLNDVIPLIFRLHYELAIGEVGKWTLGIVALMWSIDCFVAFYLTLPSSRTWISEKFFARWRQSWSVKWNSSFYRVNFDFHRAGGLWLWLALLVFAWSSVNFNLNGFYTYATRMFLDFEQDVWATPEPSLQHPENKPLEWEVAQAKGESLMAEQAHNQGFTVGRPLALYIIRNRGLYEYRVRSSRDIGDKFGWTSIFFDAYSGELRFVSLPTGQHAGNTLTTWLAELHRANLFGLPYRIFVCLLGLAITMLSVTGVYIWWKKRKARRYRERVRSGAEAGVPAE
ncbi:MAG: PepSY-associated TM helix domain-containing protein [Methylocystis silviterrae]